MRDMVTLPEAIWRRRLQSEYDAVMASSDKPVAISSDLADYQFILRGPGYKREGGAIVPISEHKISIYLTRNFPYAGGVEVIWDSPIFHPNIRESDGAVCIAILNYWSASTSVVEILKALRSMLANPNPESPLNGEAAKWMVDRGIAKMSAPKPGKPRVVL